MAEPPVRTRLGRSFHTGTAARAAWAVRAGVPRTLAGTSLSSSGAPAALGQGLRVWAASRLSGRALRWPCPARSNPLEAQLLEMELSFLTVWGPKTSDFN